MLSMTLREAWYWLAMISGLSVRYLSFESFFAWKCKFLNCGIAYLFHIHKKYMFLKSVHPFSCFGYSVFTWIECEKFFIHHSLKNREQPNIYHVGILLKNEDFEWRGIIFRCIWYVSNMLFICFAGCWRDMGVWEWNSDQVARGHSDIQGTSEGEDRQG